MTARRLLTLGVLAALGILAFRDFARLGPGLPWRTMDDFPDFYCAGRVVDSGADPYDYEPLRTCEHRFQAPGTFRARLLASNGALAIPAPQPAYDFLPFMALARVPFMAARRADAVAILLAVAGAVAALALLGVPLPLAAAVFALSAGYAGLATGQIVPFALLALVACGLALARRADVTAGVLAALTAVEPSLGLPVIAAALIFVPRARLALAVTLALLCGAALRVAGPSGIAEYLGAVLPAHAASELHFPYQYSLTYALAFLGAAPAFALAAGAVSYAAFSAFGVWLAPRAGAAFARRELLVFLPGLACVVGGAFVHQEELCFALPALAVIAVESRAAARVAAACALCVMAVPWIAVWSDKHLFLAAVFVCAIVLASLRIRPRTAVAVVAAVAATMYAFELAPPHLPVPRGPAAPYAPADLAQRAWRDYAEARRTSAVSWFAIKIPVWSALLAGLVIAARSAPARENPRSRAASVSNRGS